MNEPSLLLKRDHRFGVAAGVVGGLAASVVLGAPLDAVRMVVGVNGMDIDAPDAVTEFGNVERGTGNSVGGGNISFGCEDRGAVNASGDHTGA